MKKIAYLFYVIATWFMGCGFYKLFFYENYQNAVLSKNNVNAYVGGDAYNYIINASYSVSYFVLCLIFVIIGSTIFILNKMDTKSPSLQSSKLPTVSEIATK